MFVGGSCAPTAAAAATTGTGGVSIGDSGGSDMGDSHTIVGEDCGCCSSNGSG